MNVFADMTEWSQRPFRPDMNLGGWLAFIGLILLAIVLWNQLIKLIISV